MNKRVLILSALTALPVALSAENILTDADLVSAYQTRTYSRISCHDPSIFIDTVSQPSFATSPRYYIYGSHLGRGYTTPALHYQTWTTFRVGEESTNAENSLFADTEGNLVNYANAYSTHAVKQVKNYQGELVDFGNFDAHAWQYSGDNVQGMEWAPDVIYNPTMQKWLMYMSLNGDNWCSSIVCFASDSPEGPWVYQGPVVFSGFNGSYKHNGFEAANDYKHTDLEIVLGEQTSLPARYSSTYAWKTYWPNCIDPCVFYAEDGRLLMSYGSWFGGIFMIELDQTTGLRDYTVHYPWAVNGTEATVDATTAAALNCTCDPYFGHKIAGGYNVSGEASYIQYFKGYYYLWITNGGLTSNGGYQMRVYRSTAPEGPYKDPYGLDARPGKALVNYGSGAGRDYGVKLFGNYQWETMPVAELAQGHNSAIVTQDGHLLLVNHTRFNNGNEGHEVRVHELFQTADGWLVAAPYEYDGETTVQADIASKELFSSDEIVGDYQLMFHPFRQNTAAKEYSTPVNITLNADNTITGDYNGQWSRTAGTSFIDITLEKVLGTSYTASFHGVLVEQTIDYTNIKTLCFSACGTKSSETTQVAKGQALTTSGLCIWGSKADAKAAIKYTVDKIVMGTVAATDLDLPTGKLGATIEWTSSNPDVLSDNGAIMGQGSATLTASIRKDGYVYQKAYPITVKGDAVPTYYPTAGATDCSATWWTAFSETYTIMKGHEADFKFYNYNTGSDSNWNNWILVCTDGLDSHGSGGKEYFVLRADNYGWVGQSVAETDGWRDHAVTDSLKNTYDWNNFVSDLNGALVEMHIAYGDDNIVRMTSTTTTTAGKVLTYSYNSPAAVTDEKVGIFFSVEKSYISTFSPSGESLNIPTYYPECGATDCSATWWTAFSDTYTIDKGAKANFEFYNYNTGTGNNWNNWLLVCTDGLDSHGSGGKEYFVLRADNYGWFGQSVAETDGWRDHAVADGLKSDYNWDTFINDLNGAFVQMEVAYGNDNIVSMTSTITTAAGKIYHYSYSSPAAVTSDVIGIFFTVEKSFIRGTNINNSDIEQITSLSEVRTYDLNGRPLTEPQSGFSIVNGKLIFNK